MESVFLVWLGIEYEGNDLLGVFSDKKKAQIFCEEFEENNEYSFYSYYVTEEKVL